MAERKIRVLLVVEDARAAMECRVASLLSGEGRQAASMSFRLVVISSYLTNLDIGSANLDAEPDLDLDLSITFSTRF